MLTGSLVVLDTSKAFLLSFQTGQSLNKKNVMSGSKLVYSLDWLNHFFLNGNENPQNSTLQLNFNC